MSERVNPKYIEAVRANQGVGTPLFDAVSDKPAPPEVIKPSETRRESYIKTQGSRLQSQEREQVFKCIRSRGPISNRLIAELTRIPRSSVLARLSELGDWQPEGKCQNRIFKSGKIYDETTGRTVTTYSVKSNA